MGYIKKKWTKRRKLMSIQQKDALLKETSKVLGGAYAALNKESKFERLKAPNIKFPNMNFSRNMKFREFVTEKPPNTTPWPGQQIASGNQDYNRSYAKMGYKKSTTALVQKLNNTNVNTNIYTVANYGAWNRGEGNLRLSANQAGILGTAVSMPVHLWDVTAVPQGTGATLNKPAIFYDLNFSNETSTATVGWTTHVNNGAAVATGLDQRAAGGSIAYNPTLTYASANKDLILSGVDGGPGSNSFLEKIRASIILNGPQQRATKWCIELVQLSEEVIPGSNPDSSNVNTAFWQAMAKPYGYSPLETGPRMELMKHIKVLKKMEYIMDAPESIEDHLTARMRHVDFTAFLNRKCNYRWAHVNDLVAMNIADIPTDTNSTVFSCHVHPKARVFLMIRALCTYQGPSVLANSFIYPSYDIKIDMTHKAMD